jgi:pimeloyl-ACP methyl ester carboxylesterase
MLQRFVYLTLAVALLLVLVAGCSSTSRFYRMDPKEFDEIDYGFPMQYQDVRNIRIGYTDQGSGDVLLLIHGLGSNAKGWKMNMAALSERHRVIAVDLPGYGHSSKDYYPYSLSFYAEVLTEFLTELGIEEATFVGHSMGGQIAIIAALDHPERVDKLVLIAPAGIEEFEEGEKDWFRSVAVPELTKDATVRQIDINLKRNFYVYPPEAEFMVTDRIQVRGASDFEMYAYAVAQNIKAMVNEPTTDRLKDITQPTLVIFGEYDALIPNVFLHGGSTREVGETAEAEIPNAQLVMVDNAGHFVQFEKPEEVNRAMLRFLSQ